MASAIPHDVASASLCPVLCSSPPVEICQEVSVSCCEGNGDVGAYREAATADCQINRYAFRGAAERERTLWRVNRHRDRHVQERQLRSVKRFLTNLPEVDADFDYRYDVILVGPAGEAVRSALAAAHDPRRVADQNPLSVLCKVPSNENLAANGLESSCLGFCLDNRLPGQSCCQNASSDSCFMGIKSSDDSIGSTDIGSMMSTATLSTTFGDDPELIRMAMMRLHTLNCKASEHDTPFFGAFPEALNGAVLFCVWLPAGDPTSYPKHIECQVLDQIIELDVYARKYSQMKHRASFNGLLIVREGGSSNGIECARFPLPECFESFMKIYGCEQVETNSDEDFRLCLGRVARQIPSNAEAQAQEFDAKRLTAFLKTKEEVEDAHGPADRSARESFIATTTRSIRNAARRVARAKTFLRSIRKSVCASSSDTNFCGGRSLRFNSKR
eukprot:TRINITY_DN44079_c0_g1_i1.p1 TRINITY_DN44079_c0_g1~~TRINITY_DN44079_c0_g1_i1.p1  ORF type:complete len:463 (-),score=50.93 TRINITY_DN44079_c0_g1_i1:13-1344(-)